MDLILLLLAPYICRRKSSRTPCSWWIAHSTSTSPRGPNKRYSNNTKMVIYSALESRCYIANNIGMRARRKFSTDRPSRYRLLTMQCKWTFTYSALRCLHNKENDPRVTATVPKMRFVCRCFFSHSMKVRDLLLSAVIVSLHYLPQMSSFNSHMRQNAYSRNLKWTFVAMLLQWNKGQF